MASSCSVGEHEVELLLEGPHGWYSWAKVVVTDQASAQSVTYGPPFTFHNYELNYQNNYEYLSPAICVPDTTCFDVDFHACRNHYMPPFAHIFDWTFSLMSNNTVLHTDSHTAYTPTPYSSCIYQPNGSFATETICFTEGCMELWADNYDPNATIPASIGSANECYRWGCTEPSANNYDSLATVDDNSCAGCTDPAAANYNSNVVNDDGSCLYEGCMNPLACNYDQSATIQQSTTCILPANEFADYYVVVEQVDSNLDDTCSEITIDLYTPQSELVENTSWPYGVYYTVNGVNLAVPNLSSGQVSSAGPYGFANLNNTIVGDYEYFVFAYDASFTQDCLIATGPIDCSCEADFDINNDGQSNILDVIELVNAILGVIEFSDPCVGDINGDGDMNVMDIITLVNEILGGPLASEHEADNIDDIWT